MPVQEIRVVLTVEEHPRAVGFYRDQLGLAQITDWSSEGGQVVLLDGDHATLELIDARQAARIDQLEVGQRVGGAVRLALRLDTAQTLNGVLERVHPERRAETVDTPWGDRNVRVRAPDGMQLTLFTTT
jgi:lactoylglutathione lyase